MPQGMFTGGGGSFYRPTINPGEWGQAQYDVSGIESGVNQLQRTPALSIQSYNPFQFNTNPYGRSSNRMIGNVYNQAYNVGAKPIISQGREQMRQLGQGFGAGSIGSAANKTLQLRSAQNTGNQLQNLGGSIGSELAGRRLTQDETARAQTYAAAQQNQLNQSNANFQAAGFNADAAERMSKDSLNRAQMMMQYGFQLPQLQAELNKLGIQPWQQMLGSVQQGAYNTIQPGTSFQGGGKK